MKTLANLKKFATKVNAIITFNRAHVTKEELEEYCEIHGKDFKFGIMINAQILDNFICTSYLNSTKDNIESVWNFLEKNKKMGNSIKAYQELILSDSLIGISDDTLSRMASEYYNILKDSVESHESITAFGGPSECHNNVNKATDYRIEQLLYKWRFNSIDEFLYEIKKRTSGKFVYKLSSGGL